MYLYDLLTTRWSARMYFWSYSQSHLPPCDQQATCWSCKAACWSKAPQVGWQNNGLSMLLSSFRHKSKYYNGRRAGEMHMWKREKVAGERRDASIQPAHGLFGPTNAASSAGHWLLSLSQNKWNYSHGIKKVVPSWAGVCFRRQVGDIINLALKSIMAMF